MMKFSTFVLITLVVIIFFAYRVYVSVAEKFTTDGLEVGQRWECFYDISDPFKDPYCQRRIIDIEGRHVRYIQNEGGYSRDTLSKSAYWFRNNSRLIKEPE